MEIDSGLQGSGIMSPSPKTPCRLDDRAADVGQHDAVAFLSKPSLRPASWIGWKVTPRTQFQLQREGG